MFDISRGQVLVYAAIAVVLVVVGVSSLKDGSGGQRDLTAAGLAGASRSGESGPGGGIGSGEGIGSGSGGGMEISGGDRKLVVDVSGAVARPGVYRLADGSRVIDAIRKAGGPARGAMVGAINRAARLADGQQVVIPLRAAALGAHGGDPSGAGSGTGSGGATGRALPGGVAGGSGSAPVSLGTATSEQLQEIDGIGPVTAEKIIEFRDSKGGLGSVEDLDQVSGIGPVTMESLRSALQP